MSTKKTPAKVRQKIATVEIGQKIVSTDVGQKPLFADINPKIVSIDDDQKNPGQCWSTTTDKFFNC